MKKFLVIALFFLLQKETEAQDSVLNAVKSELDRGLKGLRVEGEQSPFFISCSVTDRIIDQRIHASMGNLILNKDNPSRAAFLRVLVGNYRKDQESANVFDAYFIPVPLTSSQNVIQYFLWQSLDGLYKNAIQWYNNKINNENKIDISEEEKSLDDFEKRPAESLIQDVPALRVNSQKLEAYVVKASKYLEGFLKQKNIQHFSADVSLAVSHTVKRYYNTEGTVFRYPRLRYTLTIESSGINKDSFAIYSKYNESFASEDALPTREELDKKCEMVARDLQAKFDLAKNKKTYFGPVLFEAQYVYAIAGAIQEKLKAGRGNQSFINSNLNNMVGLKVISNQLSCYLLNGTPTYKNKPLLGYYPIDEEGVTPPSKLVLVKDGILKSLQSNRTPTLNFLHSNGSANSMSYASNSLVFQLEGNQKYTYAQLKKKLIDAAKEEGLSFGIIIGKETRKVDVATGKEEIVDDYTLPQFSQDMNQFRHVIGVGDKEEVFQNESQTFIIPGSILLTEVNLRPTMPKRQKFDNKVPMPE